MKIQGNSKKLLKRHEMGPEHLGNANLVAEQDGIFILSGFRRTAEGWSNGRTAGRSNE